MNNLLEPFTLALLVAPAIVLGIFIIIAGVNNRR